MSKVFNTDFVFAIIDPDTGRYADDDLFNYWRAHSDPLVFLKDGERPNPSAHIGDAISKIYKSISDTNDQIFFLDRKIERLVDPEKISKLSEDYVKLFEVIKVLQRLEFKFLPLHDGASIDKKFIDQLDKDFERSLASLVRTNYMFDMVSPEMALEIINSDDSKRPFCVVTKFHHEKLIVPEIINAGLQSDCEIRYDSVVFKTEEAIHLLKLHGSEFFKRKGRREIFLKESLNPNLSKENIDKIRDRIRLHGIEKSLKDWQNHVIR